MADRAYLAGIIDGEGCIAINRYQGYRDGKGRDIYRATLTIVNTDWRLMQYLMPLGGGISIRQQRANWKPSFSWVLQGKRLEQLLREVEPYLLLKREQAQIVLTLRRLSRGDGVKRAELKARIHVLNQKGMAGGG